MSDTPTAAGVIAVAIWDELERQADRFGCVDRDRGFIDSGVDMNDVATAVLQALGLTPEWTVESRWGVEEHNVSDFYATPAGIAVWRNRNDIPTKVMQRLVGPWQEDQK